MLPAFDEWGNLPPGLHRAGWAEFVQRFGYTDHRMALIAGMAGAIGSLGRAGCRAVSVDGSFVTANEHPEDYDGCRDDVGTSTDMLDPVLRNLGGNIGNRYVFGFKRQAPHIQNLKILRACHVRPALRVS